MLTRVNGALEEAFRAHSWATRRLLEFCKELTPEQLAAGRNDATGWSILETFSHLISADGYYVGTLDGSGRPVPRWNELGHGRLARALGQVGRPVGDLP